MMTQILAEGKGGTARDRLEGLSEAKGEPEARATKRSGNPERKAMSRRKRGAKDRTHDPIGFVNRLVRTRVLGGVVAGEKNPRLSD
ncbi:MAG: hypothetical protein JRI58_13775 [Deltaproteobacteria bacterium]|nr:hypothetical protein [Deltaproteobacteria bacterium]